MWHKKIEKSLVERRTTKELGLKAEKRRHEERLKEIEKVKQQREQRERERVEKEEEREIMLARRRSSRRSSRRRRRSSTSRRRCEERDRGARGPRARHRSSCPATSTPSPTTMNSTSASTLSEIFDGLTVSEMDELVNDVKTYLDLDHKDERHVSFGPTCSWSPTPSSTRRGEDIERARVRGEEAFAR